MSRSASPSEERKTETTLTTRVRINIPGSRPIPPVVVRTPVADADSATDEAGPDTRATSSVSTLGALDTHAEPAAQAEDKPAPSDWFAPRKPTATNGAGVPGLAGIQGANGAQGAGASGEGTGPGAGTGAGAGARGSNGAFGGPSGPGTGGTGGTRPGGPGANGTGGTRPGASGAPGARPGEGAGGSSPFGKRPGGTNGAGLPGATSAGPVAPGHGGGTGSFDVSDAVAASTASFPVIGTDEGRETGRDDLPYFSEPGRRGPSGPTTGPVTGDSTVATGPGGPGLTAPGTSPGGPGLLAPGIQSTPGGPLGPGAPGAPGAAQGGPGGGLSDDTAILTPQKPAPEPGPQAFGGPGGNVSGHTVTSGIPVVPPGDRTGPFGTGSAAQAPGPHTPPKLPDAPGQQNAGAAKPAKKKGRSKLVLLGGGVVLVAGVVYGAGLLMNHSDVPKGTTVLGVDIGGGTRDEAVEKLDSALGSRTAKPLQLSVDGRTVPLTPDQAGLQLDSKATVAAAAKADYNPVSVIGSLFGQQRVVQPVMPVDEEKLQAALERVAGGTGSMVEGTIRFESGRAVPVYGKAGKGIDVSASVAAVEEAYRTQVETGSGTPVRVATTTRQPAVTNAEVDREMKEFAEPAMSANVTVKAATHSIAMSPQKSLWKFLRVTAVNGKLVDKPDLTALKALYGQTFDGVLITRGNGQKTPVTPQDVYVALRKALLSKTDRIAVINTNPS